MRWMGKDETGGNFFVEIAGGVVPVPLPNPKNKPKDTTAYLIGTGPSLNKIDISKLKDKRTITFNRAYVAFEDWGFEPSYYLSVDSEDIKSTYKDVNGLIKNSNIEKFFLPHMIQNNPEFEGKRFVSNEKVNFLIQVDGLWNGFMPMSHRVEIPTADSDLIVTPILSNAGYMGLKMLYWMGYEEVALLGCDARYTLNKDTERSIEYTEDGCLSHEDYDPNHFRDDYFGKGQRFGRPNEADQIRIWNLAASEIARMRLPIKVYSCSEGSNLNDMFPYVDFEDFINGKRE